MREEARKQVARYALGAGELNSVDWSPDGKWLAIAVNSVNSPTVMVASVDTGSVRLKWQTSGVGWTVRWSPNGQVLATGSEGIEVRSAATGERLFERGNFGGGTMGVAFSSDGRLLASGSSDDMIRLWDAETGAKLAETGAKLFGFSGQGGVWSVAFSPDGRRLVSGSLDKTIFLWDAKTGARVARFSGHEDWVRSVAFSPDGRHLASGSTDRTILIWDAETGAKLARLRGHKSGVWSVAFSPDGRLLASGSSDCTIRVWDVETSAEVACVSGHDDRVRSVAFSPDGRRLASASWDGTVCVWDTSEWLSQPVPAHGLLAAWLSRQAATVGRRVGAVAQSDDWLPSLPRDDWAGCLGLLRSVSAATVDVGGVALSCDGRRLYAGTAQGSVVAWDLQSGQRLWRVDAHHEVVQDVALSADSRRLASASKDRTIRLWDATSGGEIACMRGHENEVYSVAFSPDGRRLASGSSDGTIRVWDAGNGGEIACLRGHEKSVMSVAFSPDGRRLASGSTDDSAIRVLDAASGSEIACLRGHESFVLSVAFSPDGRHLASGSDDHTIRVWDAASGSEIACLRGHGGRVYAVAFSPDGRRLASGSNDFTIRVWDADARGNISTELKRFTFGRPYYGEGYCWRLAWASSGAFIVSATARNTFRIWDTRVPAMSTAAAAVPAAPASGHATLPHALARLPGAWLSLHRLGIAAPLSLLTDLDALLHGDPPSSLASLAGDAGVSALRQLHWRHAARHGLLALLLQHWPEASAWQPPAGEATESGEALRQALAAALAGEPCAPQPASPPLAFLQQSLARVDARLLALLAALGEAAVAADPGLPLRSLAHVGKLPRLSVPQRRLLGLRLAPLDAGPAQGSGSGVDRAGLSHHGPITALALSQLALPRPLLFWRYLNGGLLYRARSGREAPRLRPTLILLDTSPACWGPIENLTRPAAYALATTLAADGLPALFLAPGSLRVHPLAGPLGRLALLTERGRRPAEPLAALDKARALRQSLVDGALEPIILLLTHGHWGADADCPPPCPGLRALFVQYPHSFVSPSWAPCCERAETIAHDDLHALPAALGRLIG